MKSTLIAQIIETVFTDVADRRGSNSSLFTPNQGLYFRVFVESVCHGTDDNGEHHPEWENQSMWEWHVIILRNRQVFTAWTPFSRSRDLPSVDKWSNTSNHDSCWRHALSELTSLTRKVVDQAWQEVPPGSVTFRPYDERVSLRLQTSWCMGSLFKVVEVEQANCDSLDPYFKKLTSITPIVKEIVV